MPRAFVLMTAMPPTKGHMKLIEFAACIAPTTVIVNTQPHEPFTRERPEAILKAANNSRLHDLIRVENIHQTLPQEPAEYPGFWKMWANFLYRYGFQKGDYIVASEKYGIRLAEEVDGVFFPFDLKREIYACKATDIRKNLFTNFYHILPEFQPLLRRKYTLFGAESTGKTTLTRQLSSIYKSPAYFEYARPYLETVGREITQQKMENIWKGQLAIQLLADMSVDKPMIFQDTDLFSTVGYWKFFGGWPKNFEKYEAEALSRKSDLYIISKSNIPFEHDAIRYGGDKREIEDQVWIDLCDKYGLNYITLDSGVQSYRLDDSTDAINADWEYNANRIRFEREGN